MDNDAIRSSSGLPMEIVSGMPPLTVRYEPRTMTMHSVSGTELDTLSSLGNSIHLTFFGVCVGAGIAFVSILLSVPDLGPRPHATFTFLAAGAGLFAFYFGARAVADYRASKRKLKELKSGPRSD
jgi:hypothetical protein